MFVVYVLTMPTIQIIFLKATRAGQPACKFSGLIDSGSASAGRAFNIRFMGPSVKSLAPSF